MVFTWWFIVVGAVFLLMALSSSLLARLLSTAMFYLGAGILIGPHALALITIDPIDHAEMIERVTEVAVIISLFSAGLKLQLPRRDLSTPPGHPRLVVDAADGRTHHDRRDFSSRFAARRCVLLGAVLAPTDPVLASDVQVTGPRDRDRLRFTLTGEAGLNDGTAFPFVLLGLGLLGLGDLGTFGWRWFVIDGVWPITGATYRRAVGDRGRSPDPLSAPRASGDGWLR